MPAKKREEEREEELIACFEYRDGSTYEGRFQARGDGNASPYAGVGGHKRSSNAAQHPGGPIAAKTAGAGAGGAGGVASSSGGGAGGVGVGGLGAAGGPVDPTTQAVIQHGTGRYLDASGASYEGQWVEGRLTGNGTFRYASGASYTGSLLDNNYHGIGKYTWPDGSSYDGQWERNVMHGLGTYVDATGQRWYGKFFNGKGVQLQPELIF